MLPFDLANCKALNQNDEDVRYIIDKINISQAAHTIGKVSSHFMTKFFNCHHAVHRCQIGFDKLISSITDIHKFELLQANKLN